ncbi:hypothetical protein [Nocardia sp. NBC_01329]|uniref:hypothetical protein n=1 Tax=Nocardia sp. NBC_01329 TaxID=2903594 RepID=UPI002E0DF9A0|nr:hypothetical protein OG405_12485 [Nocardia sp. NBC_01329]
MQRIPGQDTSTAPHDVACRVESLLDEQARVVDELMSAETAYIESVAEARRAGLLCRSDLTEAYTRLDSWGISNFANRWRRLVGIDPEDLRLDPNTCLGAEVIDDSMKA